MKNFKVSISLIAVVALVVMIVFASHTQSGEKRLTDEIVDQPFDIDHFSSSFFTSTGDPIVDKAYQYCQKKKFKKAQELLNTSGEMVLRLPPARFLQAICFAQNNEVNKAESLFKELKALGYPFIEDQTTWCLAVMHLKQNQVARAQQYLEILAGEPTAEFHIEACTIMKELGLTTEVIVLL